MEKRNRKGDAFCGVLSLIRYFRARPAARLYASLVTGLFMNIFYISANLFPALRFRSAWSLAVTVYYAVLVLMRVFLLLSHRLKDSRADALRLCSSCIFVGRLLLLLDAAIGAVMVYTVIDGKTVDYPFYLFVGFGIFTAYSLTSSLVGVLRSLKSRSPYTLAVRNLTLAAALLSVFNLEYTLLVTLGVSRRIVLFVNMIGGALCVAFISYMGVRLILASRRKIKETEHLNSSFFV